MKKSDYRKFIIRTVESGRLRVHARGDHSPHARITKRKAEEPSLILIDAVLGQLHAAAQALESLQIVSQPWHRLLSARRSSTLWAGRRPVVLDRHSPVLHLVQIVRGTKPTRFAVPPSQASPDARTAQRVDGRPRHRRPYHPTLCATFGSVKA